MGPIENMARIRKLTETAYSISSLALATAILFRVHGLFSLWIIIDIATDFQAYGVKIYADLNKKCNAVLSGI